MPHNTDTPPSSEQHTAPETAVKPSNKYEHRDVRLELIDEPSLPIRETMDERELAEGAMSILEVGLINPLTVFPKPDGRYEVIAGHRRLLECRIAALEIVPCRVYLGDDIDPLAILVDENARREDVNPVHEGRWYWRIFNERAGKDVDKVCAIVKRRREHIEDRMLLVQENPRIVDALENKKISLAVARELAKVRDPNRLLLLLDAAVQSGATARLVAQWRQQGAELGDILLPPPDSAETSSSSSPANGGYRMECVFCEGSEMPEIMEMLWVHRNCKTMLWRMLHREPETTGATGD